MTAKNDITGDTIQTRATSQQYRDNYDVIFSKKQLNQKLANTGNTPCCEKCGDCKNHTARTSD